MSKTVCNPFSSRFGAALRHQSAAHFFGSLIRERRLDLGLSTEDAARLAGLQDSEWAAVEEGSVPADPLRLRPMADALEMSWDGMVALVMICRGAWEE